MNYSLHQRDNILLSVFNFQNSEAFFFSYVIPCKHQREIAGLMKILIRSRFPKRLNQIRSAGWLQTFHWIAFEIMPPPAESVSLDSNTCKSDSVEEG